MEHDPRVVAREAIARLHQLEGLLVELRYYVHTHGYLGHRVLDEWLTRAEKAVYSYTQEPLSVLADRLMAQERQA